MTRLAMASSSSLLLFLFLALLAGRPAAAQDPHEQEVKEVPSDKPEEAAEEEGPTELSAGLDQVAYTVGHLIPVSGPPLDDAVIVVEKGVIKAVGPAAEIEVPAFARRVDWSGMTVTPGFVNAASSAFLPSARASLDGRADTAHESLRGALDPDRDQVRDLARAGFTTLAVVLFKGGFSGQMVLVKPVAEGAGDLTVDDVLREDHAALITAFHPKTTNREFWKETLGKARKYIQDLEAFEKAGQAGSGAAKASKTDADKPGEKPPPKEEAPKEGEKKEEPPDKGKEGEKPAAKEEKKEEKKPEAPKEPKQDPKVMPIVEVLRGELPALVGLDDAAAFLHFERILEEEPGFRPVIVMTPDRRFGLDAWRIADQLAERKLALILPVVTSYVPNTVTRRVTQRILLDRGIPVALTPASGDERNAEAWLFSLGEMVRHGVPEDSVLRAVTLTPAEMLGQQAHVGSIDVGKDADLLAFSGPPFAPTTRLECVLIAGEEIYEREEAQP